MWRCPKVPRQSTDMGSSEITTASQFNWYPQPRTNSFEPQHFVPSSEGRPVIDKDVVQGCILWLPSRSELPAKAVRRAHGKGAVEEGIYNHPIVVVSRPAESCHSVHFHLVSNRSQGYTYTDLPELDHLFPGQEAA